LPRVGHVAISARNAGPGVNSLAPYFELRVLCLEHFCAGLSMLPIVKAVAIREFEIIIILFDLLGFKPIIPWEKERGFRPAVVFDMTLSADEGSHFLPGCIDIRIVRILSISLSPAFDAGQVWNRITAGRQCLDAVDKAWARDA